MKRKANFNSEFNSLAKKLDLKGKKVQELKDYIRDNNLDYDTLISDMQEKVKIKKEIIRNQAVIRGKTDYLLNGININQTRYNEILSDIVTLDNKIIGMYQYISGDVTKNEYNNIINNKINVEIDEVDRRDYAIFVVDITEKYYKKGKKDVYKQNITEITQQAYNNIIPLAEPKDVAHFANFIDMLKSTIVTVKFSNGLIEHTHLLKILKSSVTDKDLIKLLCFSMKRNGQFNIWGNSDSKIDLFIDTISKNSSVHTLFLSYLKDDVLEIL